jgi:hypothetical protein
MKQLFLSTVFEKDKPLFVLFLMFMAGQLFFTLKGVETFPFLHWGMYSAKVERVDSIKVYDISIGGQHVPLTRLPDPQKALLSSSLAWFSQLKSDGYYDSTGKVVQSRFGKMSPALLLYAEGKLINNKRTITRYEPWLFHYLSDMRLVQNSTMLVQEKTFTYNKDYSLREVSSKPIITYAAFE